MAAFAAAYGPIFARCIADARRLEEAEYARRMADARRLEEGEYAASPQPRVRGMSEATRRFMKIAMLSFTTVVGIKILVSLLVSRFVYQDPRSKDPLRTIMRAGVALGIMGAGFIPILADREEMLVT